MSSGAAGRGMDALVVGGPRHPGSPGRAGCGKAGPGVANLESKRLTARLLGRLVAYLTSYVSAGREG